MTMLATRSVTSAAVPGPSLSAAVDEALGRIPPLWPLTHFVAVNPFVGLTAGHPFADACKLLRQVTGRAPLQDCAEYRAAWEIGEIRPEDLAAVSGAGWTVSRLAGILESGGSLQTEPILTVADWLDRGLPHAHWSVFVVEEVAKWCGVMFDENQTTWSSPWRAFGLYAGWREAAMIDRNPEAFGLAGFRSFVRRLPADADAAIAHCINVLDPQGVVLTDFLHRQLVTVAGWAGHVRYRVREDELRGRHNPALKELLAIRLAYDTALFEAFARDGEFRSDWRRQAVADPDPEWMDGLARWQLAYERAYQRRLVAAMSGHAAGQRQTARGAVQAVFCIDVRSEVFRRHLEAAMPGLRTSGFAGFFGFPVAHLTPGTDASTARCPVLLVPPVASRQVSDCSGETAARERRAAAGAWKAFQNSAISCFSFVEAVGLLFAGALGRGRNRKRACRGHAPVLQVESARQRVDLAEGALRNMSLTSNFARLVLICGHGSRCANNPYAAALECGACGGHAGDVNARLAAATLNDPEVRAILAGRGIVIPEDTVFVAGLHVTVTDEVEIFDQQLVPSSHGHELDELIQALAAAGEATRRERAHRFGLGHLAGSGLLEALAIRAEDISQVRPEWGLANNAAFIAAPRTRTAGLNLEGRVFLHDYDAAADPEGKVLTLILTAPVVVASWINLQYYASRVDPRRYGSGDKALHHVIGGIGVAEGNGGDLRTGLPMQSIHDGTRFMHEPRRLTVIIEAARGAVDAVLAAHDEVRRLFENGWIHLQVIDEGRFYRRSESGFWQPFSNDEATSS